MRFFQKEFAPSIDRVEEKATSCESQLTDSISRPVSTSITDHYCHRTPRYFREMRSDSSDRSIPGKLATLCMSLLTRESESERVISIKRVVGARGGQFENEFVPVRARSHTFGCYGAKGPSRYRKLYTVHQKSDNHCLLKTTPIKR
jgi:hypothetical protein